ncbi:MAG: ferric reductase-like transmembrane domain-containing protein [Roseobacter sp.]
MRNWVVWGGVLLAVGVPIIASMLSPQLAWRQPVYIVGGFGGIAALAILLIQPMLAGGYLPGLSPLRMRQLHRIIGGLLVAAVVVHVAALWVTSPPDVVDALLFASPTPFAVWGVTAMWAVFVSALLVVLRRHLKLSTRIWRRFHTGLAVLIVGGSVLHAVLIDGTMEVFSKYALCLLVCLVSLKTIAARGAWSKRAQRQTSEKV